ncbi:hypothetical protein ABZ622_38275 [Streptomyces sp. NPDC007164]|uniref:hypothetical protein n=1 Tax=Streptomyces sp. NPDC007164 TaxID=3156918 RepID=UPI003403AC21
MRSHGELVASDPIDSYAAQEIARTAARLRYFAELDTRSWAITDGRPVRSEIRWRPQAHPHWPSLQVVKAVLTSGSGQGPATPQPRTLS